MAAKTARIIPARSRNAVAESLNIIRGSGIIVYPSESSYGIGCDAASRKAVSRLLATKKRPADKKMIAYVSSAEMAGKYCGKKLDAAERALLTKFRGKLTLVKNGKSFRMPSHRFVSSLIRKFSKPMITTSANMSGKKPIYRISKIKKMFSGKVDIIIDAGNLPRRKPSTVFDADAKKVLRKGPVSFRRMEKVLES